MIDHSMAVALAAKVTTEVIRKGPASKGMPGPAHTQCTIMVHTTKKLGHREGAHKASRVHSRQGQHSLNDKHIHTWN